MGQWEEEEEQRSRVVSLGNNEMDGKLGGGLPHDSLTLIEGQSHAGKSVLSQQLTWGGLQGEMRVAYYTTENTTRSLLKQMNSLGLDVTDFFLLGRVNTYPIASALSEKQARDIFKTLLEHIGELQSCDLIIVDALTSFISNVPESDTLSFFNSCKEFCDSGKTLIFNMHSYALTEEMLVRVSSICDAHLRLRIEEIGEQLVKTLEVAKIRGAGKTTGNIVAFDVEPNMGMRIIPISRAKA